MAGMAGAGDTDGGEPVPALALGHSLTWGRRGNAPAAPAFAEAVPAPRELREEGALEACREAQGGKPAARA